ncbi:coiled-coil domain-containing protein 115 [Microdochium nivale]|nr:coiled-coil domain-containing protein 115 [Microdochium nivale]
MSPPSSSPLGSPQQHDDNSDQDHDEAAVVIDALLERYLHLLDEYAALQSELAALQAAMYQQLARANFAAERGVGWYGRDYYDERMRASSTLSVIAGSSNSPKFSIVRRQKKAENKTVEPSLSPSRDLAEGGNSDDNDDEDDQSVSQPPSPPSLPQAVDPIRWFGLMTPMALRQAQSHGIRAVEHVVPRLATVSAEMAELEIEVRRARKRRAKAASAAAKAESAERSAATVHSQVPVS